jgi:orotidine-5'-phosphate decarboxylase
MAIAFKPQIAYFAAHRAEAQLEKLMAHMRRVAPNVPVILDAKRGDIGSTAEQYAKEAFERYGADCRHAVALHGLGLGHALPEVRRQGRLFAVPHLQPRRRRLAEPAPGQRGRAALLYEHIAAWRKAHGTPTANWAWWWVPPTPLRLHACATSHLPVPLLIPAWALKGGDAKATVKAGWRPDAPIVVSSSRAILYASSGEDYADAARREAIRTRDLLQAARA